MCLILSYNPSYAGFPPVVPPGFPMPPVPPGMIPPPVGQPPVAPGTLSGPGHGYMGLINWLKI